MSNPAACGQLVSHYCPGGREAGGGIGRLVGYVVDAAPGGLASQRIVDTRGPRWHPPSSTMRLVFALGAMARDRLREPERIHHIHIAGRGSTLRKLALAGAARLIGCRHVLHLHDYDYAADLAARPPWLKRQVGTMFRGADHVIVLGARDRQTVCGCLGADPARVSVLHNCVPDPGPAAGRDLEMPTILFLGQLGPRKGVPELLTALSSDRMRLLRWRAVLAGDGPVEEYRAEAKALELSDRVHFTGWLGAEQTRQLRAAADILVLPSHAEGLAMAVLEGLASGLAVVTTRVGAHEEAIVDGKTGAFVPVGDPEALAATLAGLVVDPAERQRLGEGGRRAYCQRFAIGGYVARLGALYQSVQPAPPVGSVQAPDLPRLLAARPAGVPPMPPESDEPAVRPTHGVVSADSSSQKVEQY